MSKIASFFIYFCLNQLIYLTFCKTAYADHCKTIKRDCSWYSEKSFLDGERCVRTSGLPDFQFTLEEYASVGILLEASETDADPMFYIRDITRDSNCGDTLVENDSNNNTERDYFYLQRGTYNVFVGNSGEKSDYTISVYACGQEYETHSFECFDD